MFDLELWFNQIKKLHINTPQGGSGILSKESHYVFNYGIDLNPQKAISLVMPIRQQSYSSGDLMGIFTMNRPEGYLRYIIEERLKRLGAPSDMFLLYLTGSHQIGRLSYSLAGQTRASVKGETLASLLSSPSKLLFEYLIHQYAFGSGISGVQPKALVPLQQQTHLSLPLETVIVKTEGLDFPDLARNEYLCLSVAKEAGLVVPDFFLSDDGHLLVIARFDRDEQGTPLGFEDMAVLTGRNSAQKYQGSYEMLAKAVAVFVGDNAPQQLYRLFERVALSCKLRDGDAHLKNFGIVYQHPLSDRYLAPVYDVVCTDIYPQLDGKLALKLNKNKSFPLEQELVDFAQRLGLSVTEAKSVLRRLDAAFDSVCQRLSQDARYGDDLVARIKAAVLAQ